MTDITYRGFEIKVEKDTWGITAKVISSNGISDIFSESEPYKVYAAKPITKKIVLKAKDECIDYVKKEIDKLYNIIPETIEELTECILSYTEVDNGFGTYIDPKVVGILIDNYYKNKV